MATVRPRPQVMRLTDAAAARIRELTERADKPIAGLRVGVKNGGCAGMSYTVEYADEIKKSDEIVEDKGVKVLVDPKAVLFLLGTEMDFKVDETSAPRFEAEGCKPFSYSQRRSGKVITVMSFWQMPERLYDDPDELADWTRQAVAVAHRAQTARPKRKRAAKHAPSDRPVKSRKTSARKAVATKRGKAKAAGKKKAVAKRR